MNMIILDTALNKTAKPVVLTTIIPSDCHNLIFQGINDLTLARDGLNTPAMIGQRQWLLQCSEY